jgi:hypothetical protein
LALFGPGLRSARRLLVGLERTSIMNPTTSGPSAEIDTPPGSGNSTCAISALFWSARNRCRIAARIESSEKVALGMIWTLLPRNRRTYMTVRGRLPRRQTMNSTGAVA